MIKSMTGYGRCKEIVGTRSIQVEIKSVNSRYLDLTVKTGRMYGALEEKLKALSSSYLSRGKAELSLQIEQPEGEQTELIANRVFAQSYVALLRQLKEEYKLGGEITIQTLANRPELFMQIKPDENMEEVWAAVEPVAKKAFEAFLSMRCTEGQRMQEDITNHLETLERIRAELVERAPQIVEESNQKMRARITELLDGVQPDEARLLTECAIFADKADISEELARLDSHFKQFRGMLNENVPIGRKLDFLLQEINRECNTIGSKSANTDFAKAIIEAKSTVEKIREQIQNIE